MERNTFIRLAAVIALGAQAVACEKYTVPASDLIPPPKSDPIPTKSFLSPETSIPPYTPIPRQTFSQNPTATESKIPTPELTNDQLLIFGSGANAFDVGTTPFKVQISEGLGRAMGYFFNPARSYSSDVPIKILGPTISDSVGKPFKDAVKSNKDGNPYFVLPTDVSPKIIMVYDHSGERSSIGDLAEKIDNWVTKNPNDYGKFIGQKLTISPEGANSLEARIAYIGKVPAAYFNDEGINGPWGNYYQTRNIEFLRTDRVFIPDFIRANLDPAKYYLLVTSCMPNDGDITGDYGHDTNTRALVVLEFDFPVSK